MVESLSKVAKGVSASCTDLSGKAPAQDLDQLAKFSELNRAVEEKLRAFGAGGLSLSCPGLDHLDLTDLHTDTAAAACLSKSLRKSGGMLKFLTLCCVALSGPMQPSVIRRPPLMKTWTSRY